ncbi:Bck1p [Rhizophagus irregularis DAOM 197198w]|uniref:Bck1p n=2 Tax=Rhizophagus irregularis TaxID=588596 RepID=A0A015LA11_RHIIW|nr:Bck1p [Rhizophagus irregularis DAOM 197198w]
MSSYLKITSTNSTPKLKSSPLPILFISFNRSQIDCSHCGNKYSLTILYNQKYCKICFLKYIKDIKDIKDTSSDTYLDIRISKNDIQRSTQNIQEIFENDYKISYFKQIVSFHLRYEKQKLEESENCKLCGKLIPQQTYLFRICPYCYQISYEWIQSTFTNKYVPILYLPWWDNCSNCIVCKQSLNFINDCQKWCSNCFYTLYIGCRYCLTTNIIFGIPDQSQCRKCKRKSSITIDITIINSGNIIIEKFFASTREEINQKIASNLNNHIVDKNSNPIEIYNFFFKYKSDYFSLKPLIEWIPYSQITKLEKTAAGGFSIIYKATCLFRKYNSMKYFKTVAIKRYLNTQDMEKYFLNELNSLYRYHKNGRIISCFGVTQDPDTKEYMLVMKYANGGNLHDYLQNNFANITWEMKLNILLEITMGLNVIHTRNFIHRDLHSGNILLDNSSWLICDLGLSQSTNNTSFNNNEIYGVLPYIAPEIFNGVAFSKKSDIYSMGMIVWELTTGCKPFSNCEHDFSLVYKIIDGDRPEITSDTPECISNLMESCWNSDPAKRPTVSEIYKALSFAKERCNVQFNKAEEKRLELIKLKKLGPDFTEKFHSDATYTSRISSNNSLFEYITKEYDYDINTQSQQSTTHITNVQDFPTKNSSRKRHMEELRIETQYDSK